jgi:hypothetical protein
MQIKNSVRTLTLASMLVFSVMSPLAAHVHAEAVATGGGSVPGDCTADQSYQNAQPNSDGTYTKYSKGDNIPQGTSVKAVDPAGNVNNNATYKCNNGSINPALVIQTGRFHPVLPSTGLTTALP